MDVCLFEAPEKMIKLHATLEQHWRQFANIETRLKNPKISMEKKSFLERKKLEVQNQINDLNDKLVLS